MDNNKAKPTKLEEPEVNPAKQSYQRPELKKHGKLKSTAQQTVVIYTTYYVL